MALASPAAADECKIFWISLFLPPSEVEFEKTSEVSARLTLKNTSQLKPVTFELAVKDWTDEDGNALDFLFGTQTLVLEGLSNSVSVSLQPKSTNWLIGFDSDQTSRTKDGRAGTDKVLLAGYLMCDQLKPWR